MASVARRCGSGGSPRPARDAQHRYLAGSVTSAIRNAAGALAVHPLD
ncbi:hypothetical protein [Acrocarpospora sp. B8E8]